MMMMMKMIMIMHYYCKCCGYLTLMRGTRSHNRASDRSCILQNLFKFSLIIYLFIYLRFA
jgi:hypothetical protein